MSDEVSFAGDAGGADVALPASGGAPPPGQAVADAKAGEQQPAKSPGSWIEDISDDSLRRRLTKFAGKPVAELAKAYAEAEALIGSDPASLVKIDENVRKDPTGLLRKLGAPETAEGYKFEFSDLPEHLRAEEDIKTFAELAARHGLLPQQAESLYKATAQLALERAKAAEAALAEQQQKDVQTLKEKYGPEFDRLVDSAKAAAKEFGLTQVLSDAGLGTNPVVIEALAKIGKLLGSGEAPGGRPAAAAGANEIEALARQALANQMKATQAGDRDAATRYAEEARRLYLRLEGGR